MATPGFIKGQLLASNLERDNDIGINNQLLYADVTNQRIGINTSTPAVDLSVSGQVSVSSLTDLGVVFANNGGILTTTAGFQVTLAGALQTPGGFETTDLDLQFGDIIGQNNLNIYTTDGSPISIGHHSGEQVIISDLSYPLLDGVTGQAIVTDGAGNLSFADVANTFQIAADLGNQDTFNLLSSVLQFTGGESITTTVSDDEITFDAAVATTASRGVAAFLPTWFDVNGAGFVGIKVDGITGTEIANNTITSAHIIDGSITSADILDGTIANTDLQNSTITIGSTLFNLGDTETELAGLTQVDIDNIRLTGSTISTTDASGNLAINANNDGLITLGTQSGVRMPAGLQSARPATPQAGTMRYNYTTNYMEYYNGVEWVNAGEAFTQLDNQEITPDGINSVFTLDHPASTNTIIVTINGLVQEPVNSYNVGSGQIIFNDIPQVTDIIHIRYLAGITSVVSISDDSGATEIAVTATEATVKVAGQDVLSIPATKVVDLGDAHSLQLPVYTVAAANLLTNVSAGQMIYVSNGDGGTPTVAVHDGTQWRRLTLGPAISAS